LEALLDLGHGGETASLSPRGIRELYPEAVDIVRGSSRIIENSIRGIEDNLRTRSSIAHLELLL